MPVSEKFLFMGQMVETPYGNGIIKEKRENDLVVIPSNWALNNDKPPTFYMNPKDITPVLKIGDKVSCLFGKGVLVDIRYSDTIHVVTISNWLLANGKSPILYVNHSMLTKDTSAILEESKIPTKKPSKRANKTKVDKMEIGSLVQTPYGKGIIRSIRQDNIILVEPINWTMADKKAPKFYLQKDFIQLLKQDTNNNKSSEGNEPDPIISLIADRIDRAIKLREDGTICFKEQNFELAREKYCQALMSLQGLGELSLSIEQRAVVFEQSVPCHNNAALCFLKLKRYPEAVLNASNAHTLSSTMESRIGSNVWTCLERNGMTIDILLKHKRKSLFLAGKAELLHENFEAAVNHFKTVLALVAENELSSKEASEYKDYLQQATTKLNKENIRQKGIWTKAFKKNTEDGIKEEKEVEEIKTKIAATAGLSPLLAKAVAPAPSPSKTKTTKTTPSKEQKKKPTATTHKTTFDKTEENKAAKDKKISSENEAVTKKLNSFMHSNYFRLGAVGFIAASYKRLVSRTAILAYGANDTCINMALTAQQYTNLPATNISSPLSPTPT
eukprot:gene4313-8577_t